MIDCQARRLKRVCAAVWAIRRPLHDGHTPRPLQENATTKSCPQLPQLGPREAEAEDAAAEVFPKLLLHVRRHRPLVEEMPLEPALEVLGDDTKERRLLPWNP